MPSRLSQYVQYHLTSCAQVHELPQRHCGDNREGTFLHCFHDCVYIFRQKRNSEIFLFQSSVHFLDAPKSLAENTYVHELFSEVSFSKSMATVGFSVSLTGEKELPNVVSVYQLLLIIYS